MNNLPTPHVADHIEPGAILVSSWGYDQTNVDYYLVTRTTDKTCWILPMYSKETPQEGYAPDSGLSVPLEVKTHSRFCDHCDHSSSDHTADYGCYRTSCECKNFVKKELVPERHKILRYGSSEFISLTSFSNAKLWDGKPKYASHYA